jgi:hypothetical protein
MNELLRDADVASDVIFSLTKEVRTKTKSQRTPLLELKGKEPSNPFVVTSIAASIESFYRSALNSALNRHLTGKD